MQHPVHKDARGTFREWFRKDELFIQTGINFEVVQTNNSLSKKATIRGVHYSSAKGGQAKLVTCIAGSIFDAVIDIRPNSPTFKKWVGIELNANSGNCLLISGGLGHAFQALENETAVSYLLNASYQPKFEFEINPLDQDLNIDWPLKDFILSKKDLSSPSLNERLQNSQLPLCK